MTANVGHNSGRQPSGAHPAGPSAAELHRDPEVWGPRLTRVLDRQRDLYTELDALSRRQGELIRDEHTDRLLSVLGQRQTLIDEITRLNQEMSPFVQEWESLAARLPERHRAALRERFAAVSGLVDAIAARDDADRRLLEQRRGEVEAALRDLPQARGAAAAYGRASAPSPSANFQDRRG